MQVNSGLNFFLWIKLLKLDESGKACMAPCRMQPQICVNLIEYLETWLQEEANLAEAKAAVRDVLENLFKTFGCPIGWYMTGERAADMMRLIEEKHFISKEFSYSPAHQQTEIDLSFINGWLFEKDARDEPEDVSDLYLDDSMRADIAEMLKSHEKTN
jgi:hypothetical protein